MDKKKLIKNVLVWNNKSFLNKQIKEKDIKIRTIKAPVYIDQGFDIIFEADIYERDLAAEAQAKNLAKFHQKKADKLQRKADIYKDLAYEPPGSFGKYVTRKREIAQTYGSTSKEFLNVLNERKSLQFLNEQMSSRSSFTSLQAKLARNKADSLKNQTFLIFKKKVKEKIKINNPTDKLNKKRSLTHIEEDEKLIGKDEGILFEQTINNNIEKKNIQLKDLIDNKNKEIGKIHKLKDFTKKSSLNFGGVSLEEAYQLGYENLISHEINEYMQKHFKNFYGRYEITKINIKCKVEKKYFNIYEARWGSPVPVFNWMGGVSYWIKDEYLAGKAHKSPFKLGINIGLSLFTFGWWIPVLIILYILHRRKFK